MAVCFVPAHLGQAPQALFRPRDVCRLEHTDVVLVASLAATPGFRVVSSRDDIVVFHVRPAEIPCPGS